MGTFWNLEWDFIGTWGLGDLEDFGMGTSGDIYTPAEWDLVTW